MPYARFEKPVMDGNNVLLTGIWCEVRLEEIAGNPMATLYSDRMGDTPLSNPFFTAGSTVAFHAAGHAYRVRIYKSGYDETFRWVAVGLGAENDLQGFTPMGAWDDETTYVIGDVVSHPDGADLYLFASKVNDNLAEEPNAVGPADDAFWMYIGIAVQGPPGPSGIIGNWLGAWVTATAYVLNDAVRHEGSSYICLESHTAGTFATDLAAEKWDLVAMKGDHGDIETVVQGDGLLVDATDPANPIVSLNRAQRVTTIASDDEPTINTDLCDAVTITALAEAITSMSANLSGTPVNFQKLLFRIKDNGTARAITWGASYAAKGVPLPTTTVLGKLLTVGFIYDSVAGTWGCVASSQEV